MVASRRRSPETQTEAHHRSWTLHSGAKRLPDAVVSLNCLLLNKSISFTFYEPNTPAFGHQPMGSSEGIETETPGLTNVIKHEFDITDCSCILI